MNDNAATHLRVVRGDFEPAPSDPGTFKTKKESAIVEPVEGNITETTMSEMNREEVKARLEASEARVATSLEAMRGDLGAGLSKIDVGLAKIDVGLAKMDTSLAQILAAVEKGKSDRYAAGYKIITWSIGTVFALAGLGLALYRAFIAHT